MGLSSFRPRCRPAATPPAPASAVATLDGLRERLRQLAAEATRYDFDDVLRQAQAYGWDRLLAGLSQQQRVDLVKRLATAVSEQRQVIQGVADAYDAVLGVVGKAADLEIERLAAELQQTERHLDLVALQARPRTSWLSLGVAGVIGYLIGNRPRPPWGCQPPRR